VAYVLLFTANANRCPLPGMRGCLEELQCQL
jgi:hypothetical protein